MSNNTLCTFGDKGICTGARWSFCKAECQYKRQPFDITKTALPLRPEERTTPNHDIYNRETERTRPRRIERYALIQIVSSDGCIWLQNHTGTLASAEAQAEAIIAANQNKVVVAIAYIAFAQEPCSREVRPWRLCDLVDCNFNVDASIKAAELFGG